MGRSSLVALTSLLFVQAGMLHGQDPKEILDQAAAKYIELKTYDFEGSRVSETKTGKTVASSEINFVYVLSRPNKVRVELRYPNAGSWVRVTDGTTTVKYLSETKEYTRAAATEYDFDMFFQGTPMANYQLINTKIQNATLVGSEPVTVGSDTFDCYVLDVLYGQQTLLPGTEPLPTRLWIDKKRSIVLKEVSGTRAKGQGRSQPTDNIRTTTFTVAKVDEPIPEELFTFTPKGK